MPASADGGRSAPPLAKQVPSVLLSLFNAFDQAALRWALLRPREGLHSPEGDVDVLVGERAMDEARRILLRAGYVEMRTAGSGLHAANFDPTQGRFLWIHVQPKLKVGGFEFAGERLLENVRRDPFPELAPEWLMWALLIRAIEKGQVPERYRDRLRSLANEWGGGPAELEQAVVAHGLEPRFLVECAAEGRWSEITEREWIGEQQSEKPRQPALTARLGNILMLFSRRGRGISVAVIGPDGAGKSTLVEGLQRTLPMRTHVVYMGLTGGKMSRARRLKLPGLVFAAQTALLWVKYIGALRHRAAGRIVLFERYVLDGAVPAGIPLSPLQRISRRVLQRVLPSADLVLLLDASGETMYERKREYSPETLEVWRSHYRLLQSTVRKFVIIDAEQGASQVLLAAQQAIWDGLRERSNMG